MTTTSRTTGPTLRILQLNTEASADKIQSPLLSDPTTKRYHILAIQEPYVQPRQPRTSLAGRQGFKLAHGGHAVTRACFYVNSSLLARDTWSCHFPSRDLAILDLHPPDATPIRIINVYSPRPPRNSSTLQDYDNPLADALVARREAKGEVILCGDFNLWHPAWAGAGWPTSDTHRAASDLLIMATHEGLHLLNTPGDATRQGPVGRATTLDLAFTTPHLRDNLDKYAIDPTSEHGSDHRPMAIILRTAPPPPPAPRRNWRKLDTDKAWALGHDFPEPPPDLATAPTPEGIDAYATEMQSFLSGVLTKCTPVPKPRRHKPAHYWPRVQEEVLRCRRLLSKAQTTRHPADWEVFRQAQKAKGKLLARERRDDFRKAMADACAQEDQMWRIARWGRLYSHAPAAPPGIPPLACPDGSTATTPEDKEAALAAAFFPEPRDHDPPGEDPRPAPAIAIEQAVLPGQIADALRSTASTSAPGPDGIPNLLLKCLIGPVSRGLAPLATAAWRCGHLPSPFRVSSTVALRKPQKADYSAVKAWRPIALLNTLGKAIEKVLATRLRDAAELHGLLPQSQMGARPQRSTETALALFTDQIRDTWAVKGTASLLAIDISAAFDRVPAPRLDLALRRKGIPPWTRAVVSSFMTHTTHLNLAGTPGPPRTRQTGIPQGSPLSPILFLFFVAGLVDAVHDPVMGVAATAFVDDVNILVVGPSPSANAVRLTRAHRRSAAWAKANGAILAPEKYELVHFTRRRTVTQAPIQIDDTTLHPSPQARILGVIFDAKLTWKAHRLKVLDKMRTQTMAISRLSQSTWGGSLVQARHIFTAVVRPGITFGHIAWDSPDPEEPRPLMDSLEKAQSQALRMICGAYKSTAIRDLQSETGICPLAIHLSRLGACAARRLDEGPAATFRQGVRLHLRRFLHRTMHPRTRHLPQTPPTPLDRAITWGRRWTAHAQDTFPPPRDPKNHPRWKTIADHRELLDWQDWWDAGMRAHPRRLRGPAPSLTPRPTAWNELRPLHLHLPKAVSAIIVQCRTGHVGLRAYLCWRHVPDYQHPLCDCGHATDTIIHRLAECPLTPPLPPHIPRPHSHGGSLCLAPAHAKALLVDDHNVTREVGRWLLHVLPMQQFKWARRQVDSHLPREHPFNILATELATTTPPGHTSRSPPPSPSHDGRETGGGGSRDIH